ANELGQRCLDELVTIVSGFGEDRVVLDEGKVVDLDPFGNPGEFDGLEAAVADIDSPGGICHDLRLRNNGTVPARRVPPTSAGLLGRNNGPTACRPRAVLREPGKGGDSRSGRSKERNTPAS